MKLMKLKLMCQHRQHCKPIITINYISVIYWLTIGLQCLHYKNIKKIAVVNIVNRFSSIIRKILFENQIFIKIVYKVDDVDGINTIYSHAKKTTP